MTKPVRTRHLAPALLAAVLTLTGCGGSDEADRVPETTEAEATTTPPTTKATATTAVTEATTTTEPAPDIPGRTRVLLPGSGSGLSDDPAALFVGDDKRPRVVYVSGSGMIAMAVCENAACTEVETHAVTDISPLDVTHLVAVGFTGDGRPMAAYSALDPTISGGQPFKHGVAWCNDPDCIETDSFAPDRDCVDDADCGNSISKPGQLGRTPSFATSPDGRRYLATWSNGIMLLDCSDQYCPPAPADLVLTDPEMGQPVLGFTPAGNPLLVLEESVSSGGQQPPTTNVWLASCSDPTCEQPPLLARVFDSEPGVYLQVQPPLITDTGLTIIMNASSYDEFSDDDLPDRVIVIGCDDYTCTNPTVNTVATGIQGAVAALGPDQLPRLAWADPNQQVSYTRCDDPACTTYTTETLSGAGQVRNLYTTAETTLLVTESSNTLYLNICPADNCLS